MSNLIKLVTDYENSMLRAIFMLQLKELADKFNHEGGSENHEIAHLLRCVWIAAHQGRVQQLSALISDTVDEWISQETQE